MKVEALNKKTFARVIDSLDERNFDGHTDFHALSMEQKLRWLSAGAQFWFLAKSISGRFPLGARKSGRLAKNVKKSVTRDDVFT